MDDTLFNTYVDKIKESIDLNDVSFLSSIEQDLKSALITFAGLGIYPVTCETVDLQNTLYMIASRKELSEKEMYANCNFTDLVKIYTIKNTSICITSNFTNNKFDTVEYDLNIKFGNKPTELNEFSRVELENLFKYNIMTFSNYPDYDKEEYNQFYETVVQYSKDNESVYNSCKKVLYLYNTALILYRLKVYFINKITDEDFKPPLNYTLLYSSSDKPNLSVILISITRFLSNGYILVGNADGLIVTKDLDRLDLEVRFNENITPTNKAMSSNKLLVNANIINSSTLSDKVRFELKRLFSNGRAYEDNITDSYSLNNFECIPTEQYANNNSGDTDFYKLCKVASLSGPGNLRNSADKGEPLKVLKQCIYSHSREYSSIEMNKAEIDSFTSYSRNVVTIVNVIDNDIIVLRYNQSADRLLVKEDNDASLFKLKGNGGNVIVYIPSNYYPIITTTDDKVTAVIGNIAFVLDNVSISIYAYDENQSWLISVVTDINATICNDYTDTVYKKNNNVYMDANCEKGVYI